MINNFANFIVVTEKRLTFDINHCMNADLTARQKIDDLSRFCNTDNTIMIAINNNLACYQFSVYSLDVDT